MEEVRSEEDLISDAIVAAKAADIVICVLGLNDERESEGYDRASMSLPGAQDRLIWHLLEVAGVREKLIVVNQSGSPVYMPWDDQVYGIVQAWYGGQEAGHALLDVLTGTVTPSGRFPITWPREYADLGFEGMERRWPGVEGEVLYEEGAGVGYRWFQGEEREKISRWWFGYGLGYTTFALSNLTVMTTIDGWKFTVSVRNTGSREGREVIPVYSSFPSSKTGCLRELRGFEKTAILQPGEETEDNIVVHSQHLANWNVDQGKWALEEGSYVIEVGKHVGDAAMLTSEVGVEQQMAWDP